VTDGTTFSAAGGLDGGGTALSGTQLGPSILANGTAFLLGLVGNSGQPGAGTGLPFNVVSADGQVVSPAQGQFTTLSVLGTGVNGDQTNQKFTVTYTDGTSDTFTQSLSDWYTPQNFPGETIAATTVYRNLHDGTMAQGRFNVYAYSFALSRGKTVKSVTLPQKDAANVEILGMTLT
jgi:hypothetical protein